MIEFYGNMSDRCKQYILKKESKVGLLSGFITAAIFSIPMIILTFTIHWIFILTLPVLAILAILASMPPNKKNYNLIIPTKIIVDINEKTIISTSEKFYIEKSISDIICINDMGEWYHIYFGEKIDRVGRFVCQKDLIHGCTLEEFENFFKQKIIRK